MNYGTDRTIFEIREFWHAVEWRRRRLSEYWQADGVCAIFGERIESDRAWGGVVGRTWIFVRHVAFKHGTRSAYNRLYSSYRYFAGLLGQGCEAANRGAIRWWGHCIVRWRGNCHLAETISRIVGPCGRGFDCHGRPYLVGSWRQSWYCGNHTGYGLPSGTSGNQAWPNQGGL